MDEEKVKRSEQQSISDLITRFEASIALEESDDESLYVMPVARVATETLKRQIPVYRYLKETYDASTVGEAHALLRRRQVDPTIVQGWLADPMFSSPILFASIAAGYPELMPDIEQSQQAYSRILNEEHTRWKEKFSEGDEG